MFTVGYICSLNDSGTTEIYTLSLHALFRSVRVEAHRGARDLHRVRLHAQLAQDAVLAGDRRALRLEPRAVAIVLARQRSEEHTSELQSQSNLVCRLLLEKKKKQGIAAFVRM